MTEIIPPPPPDYLGRHFRSDNRKIRNQVKTTFENHWVAFKVCCKKSAIEIIVLKEYAKPEGLF